MPIAPSIRISALALASVLIGCLRPEVRRESYPDGTPRSSLSYLRGRDPTGNRDFVLVRHGPQWTWHPDGRRASLDIYVQGYHQGYSFRWHPNGKLQSLERFRDGERDGEARAWD